ncbi:hypothetical protein DNTS_016075 [Danionella cerebrum]|uniref:Prolyl 3-hydroxylase OGFOD1 n=1 Tax=Danionella cerebrum TaxID=2873325 RepID=A0A553QHU1_9TELE|nr:hypothetical protein DNTS_016075 [Danionella translucida]
MPVKKRQSDSEPCKKNKKERLGEPAVINSDLRDDAVQRGVRDAWQEKESYSKGPVHLDCQPFPHCQITDFLQSESFVDGLQAELLQLNFNSKSNDLYKFQQSDDLKERREHHISQIRYVLLCHDDELEGRRVAFILYLVPLWEMNDGGTLDLFSTDEHCQPVSVVKSLLPRWNSLVFFEVSPVSFHQVAEVVSEEKCRLSLSGWFHGPSLPRPSRYIEPSAPRSPHIPRDETMLFEWVNEMYLDPRYQARVQQEFEDSSEICLPSFLQEEKLREVRSALQSSGIQWSRRGPPNKRSYGCTDIQSTASVVKECWELLSSEPFFILLANLTGLSLHYLCSNEEDGDGEENSQAAGSRSGVSPTNTNTDKGPPTFVGELRRWAHGDYTLLHDSVKREYALDLQLHMGCSGTSLFTDPHSLLTVYPEDNSLALVYRDKDTLKFIKHINNSSSSHTAAFYDFSFTYYEQ